MRSASRTETHWRRAGVVPGTVPRLVLERLAVKLSRSGGGAGDGKRSAATGAPALRSCCKGRRRTGLLYVPKLHAPRRGALDAGSFPQVRAGFDATPRPASEIDKTQGDLRGKVDGFACKSACMQVDLRYGKTDKVDT